MRRRRKGVAIAGRLRRRARAQLRRRRRGERRRRPARRSLLEQSVQPRAPGLRAPRLWRRRGGIRAPLLIIRAGHHNDASHRRRIAARARASSATRHSRHKPNAALQRAGTARRFGHLASVRTYAYDASLWTHDADAPRGLEGQRHSCARFPTCLPPCASPHRRGWPHQAAGARCAALAALPPCSAFHACYAARPYCADTRAACLQPRPCTRRRRRRRGVERLVAERG